MNSSQIVFYSIEGSSIKKFLIIDLILGTGIYYAIKAVSTSMLMGMLGSVLGAEGIKRMANRWHAAVK